MKTKFKSNYQFIANGKLFKTFADVEKYAESMGLRVSNTEKHRGRNLITLTK